MITSLSLTRAALAGALLATAALPAADAGAAKRSPSTAIYEVTVRAEMTDQWNTREHYSDDCKLTGNLCVRAENGQGSAKLNVRTGKPFRMMVMRGFGGRPPQINVGTGEGAPVSGPYLRDGSVVTEYSGPWDAANPDRAMPTTGCGKKTIKGDMNFTWRGRNQLAPMPMLDVDRPDCPTGPSSVWQWDGGDSPSLGDVVTQASQNKFLKTKQFTVGGSKTWTAKQAPINRTGARGSYIKDGSRTVTWKWEATFRMKGAKRKRR